MKQVKWLLVLLAVLLAATLPALQDGVGRLESLRTRMEGLEVAQGRYRELVIGLRHGVTSNYDEANAWMARILEQRAALAAEVAMDIALHRLWLPYHQAVQDQEALWNDFKRRNALVRNSLHYFQSDALHFARALADVGGACQHRDAAVEIEFQIDDRVWLATPVNRFGRATGVVRAGQPQTASLRHAGASLVPARGRLHLVQRVAGVGGLVVGDVFQRVERVGVRLKDGRA